MKTYVSRLLTRLDLRDRVQLAVLAYESGLVTPGRRDAYWSCHQATVSLTCCSKEVGARPSRSSLRRESITNGRSNWYDVSASSRMSTETTPMALNTQEGTAQLRGVGTPAAAAIAATSSRWVPAATVGACSTVSQSSGSSDAVTIARARSGT